MFGDFVEQSQVIGQIGPFNLYYIINTPNKDKKGNPKIGSKPVFYLNFSIKINGSAVNPLEYITVPT